MNPQVFEALRGQINYTRLLRTRPVFTDGECLLHMQALSVLAQNEPSETPNKSNTKQKQAHPKSLAAYLGLIVPKKRYALAVERNRVKRIARAAVGEWAGKQTTIAASPPCLLVRFKPAIKNKASKKTPLAAQAENTAKRIQGLPSNTNSRAFSRYLREQIERTLNAPP